MAVATKITEKMTNFLDVNTIKTKNSSGETIYVINRTVADNVAMMARREVLDEIHQELKKAGFAQAAELVRRKS